MRIDINELEILAPDTPAEPDRGTDSPATDGSSPARPAADLGEQLRRWHRETRARELRLTAD
ncbi:hypothetical protein [Streptomyces sp. NPDC002588]|uniref:hypothetical protein n=1 Tax=Streptomyces sp. NPDC002588 TaxID=3154419 RepID=UPI003333B5C3